jgi:hypothetical protein
MKPTKLTPIEVLQKRKIRLSVKADALQAVLEENLEYLQENFGALIRETTTEALIAKMPPFVQNLIGRGKNNISSSQYEGIAEGAIGLVPFFLKGGKGFIVSVLLNQLKKLFFK